MNCVRVFSDLNGESHFDDVAITLTEANFAPPAPPLLVSAAIEAKNLIFCTVPAGWDGDWHPTPARQYFLLGQLEVEVSDGEIRQASPGAIVLLEDISGKGHVTRVLGNTKAEGVFVQVP